MMKRLTYSEHRKFTEKRDRVMSLEKKTRRDRVSYKEVRMQKGMDFATSHNPLIAHPKSG